ncbi:hypothetical protein ACFL3P_01530 [Pseudomonadota bacterium]
MNKLLPIILLPAICFADTSANELTLNGVSIGDKKEHLISNYPEVREIIVEPSQFGTLEERVIFNGATAHVTDGVVQSIEVFSPKYKTPSGIHPKMSLSQAKKILGKELLEENTTGNNIRYALRKHDCALFLFPNNKVIQKVKLWCAQ